MKPPECTCRGSKDEQPFPEKWEVAMCTCPAGEHAVWMAKAIKDAADECVICDGDDFVGPTSATPPSGSKKGVRPAKGGSGGAGGKRKRTIEDSAELVVSSVNESNC